MTKTAVALAALFFASSAVAQDAERQDTVTGDRTEVTDDRAADRDRAVEEERGLLEREDRALTPEARINDALELPVAAFQLRQRGVPESEINQIIDSARNNNLHAAETRDLLQQLAQVQFDRATVAHLGDVVSENLDEGLRGTQLVTAVNRDLQARATDPDRVEERGLLEDPDDHERDAEHDQRDDHY